ncbi:hypothetical protein LCGC14_3167630, partial [marine sediment metagenome]
FQVAVWFDRETPGFEAGNLLHVAWAEELGADDFWYVNIDISDASVLTKVLIANVTTTGAISERCCITRTRSGNLIASISTQANLITKKSDDVGATWSDIAELYEAGNEEDWSLLFPANTADGDDACSVFWDRSADELSVKIYDDSADTWTETSIATSMVDDTRHINMDGSIRQSDGHLLVAAHSNDDTTGDDLLTWDITVDSIASPTVTAKTNVFTNEAESAQCCVFINQQNDDVYVGWLSGDTNWQATVSVVFKKSTDGMGIWGTEQAYSETIDDYRHLHAGRTVGDDGGFFQICFFDNDDLDLFVNLVNDVAIAAVVVGEINERTISSSID